MFNNILEIQGLLVKRYDLRVPLRPTEPTRMKLKWPLAAAAAGVCIGLSIYYADLLKAAFTLNPIPRSSESIARGKAIFQQNCVVCHGPGGRGDGSGAASFPARPKDLSRLAPPPIFPDGVIAYRIANGVNLMPAWKTVLGNNDVWDLMAARVDERCARSRPVVEYTHVLYPVIEIVTPYAARANNGNWRTAARWLGCCATATESLYRRSG